VRYISDQGHIGDVARVDGERRFSEAQIELLRQISGLVALGFLLPDAVRLAREQRGTPSEVDLQRLATVARASAAQLQRSLHGWLLVLELIGNRLGNSATGGGPDYDSTSVGR
jgi:DNA-binding transcriptional MerR regulator